MTPSEDELRDEERYFLQWRQTKSRLSDIDPELRDLIVDLNEAGYYTQACCQGRKTLAEFKRFKRSRSHSPRAYIFFWRPISRLRIIEATEAGLNVYGDNLGILSTPVKPEYKHSFFFPNELRESIHKKTKLILVEANQQFVDRVRKIWLE